MKRIIAISLILTFCFSLCGCQLIKRECEYCHNAVGTYRDDVRLYDYLCYDCYSKVLLDDDGYYFDDYDQDDYDSDLYDYYDYDDYDDDDDYFYSNNYCDNCGDSIPSNRNYCDDCLEDFLDSLDNY